MANKELREKIVNIALHAAWTDIFGDHYSIGESAANAIADALIAAGIGDVSEYKHRAEVAEKQVYCLAKMFAEALCKNGNTENLMQGFIKDAQKEAEKELQEKRK